MKELNEMELREVDGGLWQAVLAAVGAGIYVYNNWGDFVAGMKESIAEN